MESNLVDNLNGLYSFEAIELIESLFKKHLAKYILKEKNDKIEYFVLTYCFENIDIYIGGDRGYIEYCLKINDSEIDLREYDERLKLAEAVSSKNIHFIFNVICRFLNNG